MLHLNISKKALETNSLIDNISTNRLNTDKLKVVIPTYNKSHSNKHSPNYHSNDTSKYNLSL